ncbi:MAG TPA: flagellar type III secretion system pore protein FliP [Thermoclostridium caenicola]|uniref:Flagellar biosynthetic protein FliP n=1 Tax=Thermoclostridium caenicola TaxID=659425 RepID=A0A1M6FZA5_9FIRM|nr:flagellar type III secretion system pore protein FliP [Thermoclostridium caenicola]SHJ02990.1 flagellar biosynthetic protein FliP [Thermoclostridium caenicola]HOK42057.1 flagellar type III secretion system pore protein FliP [Thermoclostridium caenicola]HOL84700.1 flagellar type III secretion system pore protein FliP [Thermoclostridium caenicola]HPO75848.1 flagellar type III secretion system pore protein FliP [Thermoclostridium caenicola]HPU21444.1 flagellar type III secretion system pore pr
MQKKKLWIILILAILFLNLFSSETYAAPGISISDNGITIQSTDDPQEISNSIKLLLLLTVLTLLPSILIMMTSFTRIVIVFSFLRNSMGTQQIPPNQVIIGLALFLTFFIMTPVFADINQNALEPFSRNEITLEEAIDRTSYAVKDFMLDFTREKDLALFAGIARIEPAGNLMDLPLTVVVPAFMISELNTAFRIGFMLYIPFLVIDMVVASTLMAMGMMMLPPSMISMPFKILLFLLVDGWNLLTETIIKSFAR